MTGPESVRILNPSAVRPGAKKPTIALCSAGELYGGIEEFIYCYAIHLMKGAVFTPMVLLFHDATLAKRLRVAGHSPVIVQSRYKYDLSVIARIEKVLRSHQVDIVHTHGYKANILCGRAARRLGVPIVRTEHGNREPSAGFGNLKMIVNTWLDARLARYWVDKVVHVSRDIMQQKRGWFPNIDGRVIYNGIPSLENSAGGKGGDRRGKIFRVGVVGRLSKVKGHIILLKALKKLDREDIRLLVFGEGPLERELRAYCQLNGLSKRVVFMGFREDILRGLARLDLVVMPSLHEGFPYALLQAASLKVPFIASDVGGIREIFKDGEDGLLVPPGNVEALAEAVRVLCDNPPRREQLSECAFKKVRSGFSMEDMARQYQEVYLGVGEKYV